MGLEYDFPVGYGLGLFWLRRVRKCTGVAIEVGGAPTGTLRGDDGVPFAAGICHDFLVEQPSADPHLGECCGCIASGGAEHSERGGGKFWRMLQNEVPMDPSTFGVD
eukprot:s4131_g2.t1